VAAGVPLGYSWIESGWEALALGLRARPTKYWPSWDLSNSTAVCDAYVPLHSLEKMG
jgi:hypothetical protein